MLGQSSWTWFLGAIKGLKEFCGLRVASLLFAHDVVLVDLQLSLEQRTAKCEAVEM